MVRRVLILFQSVGPYVAFLCEVGWLQPLDGDSCVSAPYVDDKGFLAPAGYPVWSSVRLLQWPPGCVMTYKYVARRVELFENERFAFAMTSARCRSEGAKVLA